MKKLDGKSLDIKEQNIEQLKELFPEVFSEGKINLEKLQEELGNFSDDENERYNFTWNGKQNAKKIAQTPSTGTLRPCKEESKDWDTTQNLYIEGDNLEVLKLLQKSYHKQVKMIYIDPPYNTGKDFVYKDNFKDNIKNYLEVTNQVDSEGNKLSVNADTNGRYHSDWLSMMYPRLKLARNLLKDDGVIFISIDDNEVANLRKLCDEIFGEDNFVGELKWKKKKQPSYLATHIAGVMEYIIIFAKNKTNLEKLSIEGTTDTTKKVINISNSESERIFKVGVRIKLGNEGVIRAGKYKIKTMTIEYKNDVFYKDGKTINEVKVIARFLNTQENIDKFIEEDLLFISKNFGLRRDVSKEDLGKRKSITDLLLEWGDNQESDKEQLELLGSSDFFDYTKPTLLIKNFVKSLFSEKEIILDFFSGSATTAHAVMQLNAEDKGNRKYICVQIPEPTDEKSEAYKAGYKNICEIGKERIRRAGKKIVEDNSDKDLSHLDIGFKVYKLDNSNIKEWDSDFENLEQNLLDAVDNIKEDRTSQDLLYEIILKYGLDLTLPIEEMEIENKIVYNIGFGALVVCLDDEVTINVVEKIAEFIKEQVIYDEEKKKRHARVVFKDGSFKDSVLKTNAIQVLKQADIDEVVSV